RLVVTRDRPDVRRHPIRQIEQRLIDVTPAPALGRIVAFDDRMSGAVEMLGCVLVRRIIATADVTTGPAEPQMQPGAADLQAFLAAERAWRDVLDVGDMGAVLHHAFSPTRYNAGFCASPRK